MYAIDEACHAITANLTPESMILQCNRPFPDDYNTPINTVIRESKRRQNVSACFTQRSVSKQKQQAYSFGWRMTMRQASNRCKDHQHHRGHHVQWKD
jgi:hypothetical protein